MDPISHYMFAYALGRKGNIDTIKLKALTFGALLPDIDVFTIVLGIDFVKNFHGTYTHSILIALLLSVVLSLIFLVYYKKLVFIYAAMGASLHLLLDVVNTLIPDAYGAGGLAFLYPFTPEKLGLAQTIPNPMLVWIIVAGTIFGVSIFLLFRYIKMKEYPWRIWVDERKIIKFLKNIGRKKHPQ